MVNLKRQLKIPEAVWNDGTITRHNHIEILQIIDDVLTGIDDGGVQKQRFMESCFGHFLRMHRTMQFSGTIVHQLLLREIHHDGSPDEMRFVLGDVNVRFSKIEFCLITGLKFRVVPDTTEYSEVENGIHRRYFGGRDEVKIDELKERVQEGGWTEEFDAVKLCLLLLLHLFLNGADERGKVPIWQLRLVDNLVGFDAFPWGSLVYNYSIFEFKNALRGRKGQYEQRQKYNMWGFSYALLIFAVEVIPDLAREFTTDRRDVDPFPRILKWRLTKRPRPDKVKKVIKDRVRRGKNVAGCLPWNKVDTLLIPVNIGGGHWLLAKVLLSLRSIRLYDPSGQQVPHQVRSQQLACLRWFLTSMLNQVGYYKQKQKGTTMKPNPFSMVLVSPNTSSEQSTDGNCGAQTLALIEHIVADIKKFNWHDEDLPAMRLKMAMEVFANSIVSVQ